MKVYVVETKAGIQGVYSTRARAVIAGPKEFTLTEVELDRTNEPSDATMPKKWLDLEVT